MNGGCYSRVGPREISKRYSKGSRRPQKVRQARERCKVLVKQLKGVRGASGGVREGPLIFDIIF